VAPPPPPELAEFEEVARLVSQVRRKVWSGVSRALSPDGESVLGWAVVATLERLGPLSQRDLAEMIGQHPAGISRQLSELDRAGLTTRALDVRDRRRRLVALTPAGRRWHRRWRPRVLAAVGSVLGVLDPGERAGLRQLLQKVLAPNVVRPEPVPRRAGRATLR
jgi:DNA-binding MarR family transcriptional regulator